MESIFMQMHNGTRTGEGSFNVALKELFYVASQKNRCKLVRAFPEFFGNEVREFDIQKQAPSENNIIINIESLISGSLFCGALNSEKITEQVKEALFQAINGIYNSDN